MEKEPSFLQMCWENWISMCKRTELDPYLTPYIKTTSKWIKDLIVGPKTIKLIEENSKSFFTGGGANMAV